VLQLPQMRRRHRERLGGVEEPALHQGLEEHHLGGELDVGRPKERCEALPEAYAAPHRALTSVLMLASSVQIA
jgi:hypothetical protein